MSSKIKAVISILCITIIIACLVQAIPRYNELQKTRAALTQSGTTKVSEPTDLSVSMSSETAEEKSDSTSAAQTPTEDYRTTQEYKDNNDRIAALRERLNLLSNDLISDLRDITRMVFDNITQISAEPKDEGHRAECRKYMTDDFYERFKDMKFEATSHMVYDIKFSDLDKDDITAYVFTRGSLRFFVTYSFDYEKNYVISDIEKLETY